MPFFNYNQLPLKGCLTAYFCPFSFSLRNCFLIQSQYKSTLVIHEFTRPAIKCHAENLGIASSIFKHSTPIFQEVKTSRVNSSNVLQNQVYFPSVPVVKLYRGRGPLNFLFWSIFYTYRYFQKKIIQF